MDNERQILDFSKWLTGYPGQYFIKHEQEQLNSILPRLYGYYLVQLGGMNCYDLSSLSPNIERIYVGRVTEPLRHGAFIESNFSNLPFQNESVDAFLLPHTLEFTSTPGKVIDEIYHILIPGGKLLILGYNPHSLFGLSAWFKLNRSENWPVRFHSLGELKWLMNSRGFSIDYQKSFCFRPVLRDEKILKRLDFLESMGPLCFPRWGGVFLILAEKKKIPLVPIRRSYSPKKVPVSGRFLEPSVSKGSRI